MKVNGWLEHGKPTRFARRGSLCERELNGTLPHNQSAARAAPGGRGIAPAGWGLERICKLR